MIPMITTTMKISTTEKEVIVSRGIALYKVTK